jgi:RNA polymerase sigma-70 factor (ECF subfamily)
LVIRSIDLTHVRERMQGPLPDEARPRETAFGAAQVEEEGPAPTPGEASTNDRFRDLFEQHFAFVWRTLRRLGVPTRQLPDASQRVFWVAAQKLADIAAGNERGFFFGTARRVAADFRRLDQRTVPLCEEAFTEPWLSNPEELLDQKRARELLDRLLDAMPIELREVLILQEGEGMSLAEIAELMGIPQGTAASRLRRARAEFRRLLTRWMARGGAKGDMR